MKKTTRTLQAVALTAVGLLTLWQGMALAGDAPEAPSPPSGETSSAPSAPADPGSSSSSSSSAPDAPATATLQEDSEGHTTPQPSGQPHATAQVAEVNVAGEEVVTIGETHSEIDHDDDDASSGDVTVLAIGGEEVVGVHSDSETGPASDATGAAVACEPSGGAVCVGLLFAETESSNTSTQSSSSADTVLLFACVGGSGAMTEPQEDCDGLVGAGAADSHSSIAKDKNDGSETADASTDAADVCIGPEGEVAGVCSGIGVTAVHSESHSEINDDNGNRTTEDDTGSTESSSYLLGIDAGGEQVVVISDPQSLAIPPGCPEDGSLVCLFINQGTAFEAVSEAGSRQEAIHIDVLKAVGQIPGDSLILGHLGVSETLVRGQAGLCPEGFTGTPPDCEEDENGNGPECPPGTVGTPPDCVEINGPQNGPRGGPPTLAFTGLGALPLLALSLILGTAGGSVLAWDRRRKR